MKNNELPKTCIDIHTYRYLTHKNRIAVELYTFLLNYSTELLNSHRISSYLIYIYMLFSPRLAYIH